MSAALGTGSAGGDFGDLLTKPVSGDFNLFRKKGAWGFGLGLNFTSLKMVAPYFCLLASPRGARRQS